MVSFAHVYTTGSLTAWHGGREERVARDVRKKRGIKGLVTR